MTGGNFDTSVVANEFYTQSFRVEQRRARRGAGGDPVHPRHPDHRLQRPADAELGGPMSTSTDRRLRSRRATSPSRTTVRSSAAAATKTSCPRPGPRWSRSSSPCCGRSRPSACSSPRSGRRGRHQDAAAGGPFFANPQLHPRELQRRVLARDRRPTWRRSSSTRSSSRSPRCSSRSALAAAGGVRLRLDDVPGPRLPVRRGLRAADRADPGDADPAAAALRAAAVQPAAARPDAPFWPVWLSHTIFALPLAIFLLHNFMKEIPGELIEAARVDGAGHVQIFFADHAAAAGAGDRRVRDLPVPVGVERPAGRPGLRRRQPERRADHRAAGGAVRHQGPASGSCSPRARSSRSSCRWSCSSSLQRYFVRGLLAGSVKG